MFSLNVPRHNWGARLCAFAFLTFGLLPAQAADPRYSRDNYRDMRALGRGNTGVASIKDGAAIFYNPAALGEVKSFSFSPFNPVFGGNQNLVTATAEVMTITGGNAGIAEMFSPFLGRPIGVQGMFMPAVVVPGLAFGFYDSFDVKIAYRNPVYPRLDIEYKNDYGFGIGYGKRIAPGLYVGTSMRYVARRLISETLQADTIFSLDAAYLRSLQKIGDGWAFTTGAKYVSEIDKSQSVSLGVTWEDMGYSRFKAKLNQITPGLQVENVKAGVSYFIDTAATDFMLSADVVRITERSLSYSKKVNLGAELRLPVLDLRAGVYHGYWTAGVSAVILPFIELDLTTYAEELDSFAGIRSNRIWMIGIRTGIDIKQSERTRQKIRLEDI